MSDIDAIKPEIRFNSAKAEQTLKDYYRLYAQVKFVGSDDTINKEMRQVYSRLACKWFGMQERKRRGIPSELR
jgi:hypothetical protein